MNEMRTPRAHVDGISGNEIRGWAQPLGDRPSRIGAFAGDRLLAETHADRHRPDLSAAGLGDVAFLLPVAGRIAAGAAATDGRVDIRRLDGRGEALGSVTVPVANRPSLLGPEREKVEAARKFLRLELDVLLETLDGLDDPDNADGQAPAFRQHGKLLAPVSRGDDGAASLFGAPLSAYLALVKDQYGLGHGLQPEQSGVDRDRFLARYLSAYSAGRRRGYRVPMTRADIAYLNEEVSFGDTRYRISRALAWQIMAHPSDRRADLNLDDLPSIHRAEFWWAWVEAPRLGVEDCLIAPATVARLGWTGGALTVDYPLSPFLHHLANALNLPMHVNGEFADDRRLIYAFAVIKAVRHPHILPFLDRSVFRRLCGGDEGGELAQLFADLGLSLPRGVSAARLYAAALRRHAFDLDQMRFLTTLPDGNRVHAATMPAPPRGAPCADVQVIGPFEKASGLGQATRLSAEALRATGYTVNCVDFDLDNPAPEGFSGRTDLRDFRPARVNLLHLNAESVPLAYAYGADVYSDAYNIGYFFWELDRPALCHKLAFDLLDEVWVSTDWLNAVYAGTGAIPVTTVGLPAGQPAALDPEAAREALRRRIGARPDDFVFFFDFDSFSFIQRKNPLATLEAFARAFPADPGLRLVVKSQNRHNVIDSAAQAIWAEIDRRADADPRIALIVETLPFDQLLQLKAGADCYVSLHRAEGWGFGMIEAMQLGVPVICTGYSGNTAFCDDQTAWIVDHRPRFVAPEEYLFVRPGHSWADPDIDHAARQMQAVRADADGRARRAAAARARVAMDFSVDAVARRYKARIDAILSPSSDA